MLIGGKRLDLPEPKVIVIPRNKDQFVFKIKPVLDTTEMEKIYPEPKPPMIQRPGKSAEVDNSDPEYRAAYLKWGSRKFAWMVIESLSATADIKWEKVDINNPDTWDKYEEELRESLSVVEYNYLLGEIVKICGLTDSMIKEATESFLASQARLKE